ncbi:MAG: MerR family transcriptional regulator, partial [Muribaculaceae bacterium]|nr:MerR family transcriptional regulator [Muribaculaceae bacterium]
MSTLRYWESQFTIIKPKRTPRGTRLYRSSDIEKIRMVNYLVKERGM